MAEIFLMSKGDYMYKTLSSGLLGIPGKTLRDDVQYAVKFGYEGVLFDIKAVSTGFSPSEFNDLLAKNNLKSGGFGLPVDFRKDQETFDAGFKNLKAYCEFAKQTGTTRCNTWLMPCSDTLDYKSNFKLHRDRLAQIAKLYGEYGVRLGLEFVGPATLRKGKAHEFIHNLDGLNELLDAIGTSNVGYLLDAFHWDTAGQVSADFKKITNEKIVVVHINDGAKGVTLEEQMDQQRELPGATGVLRIGEFMKGLKDLNYDGPVAVEPFNAALRALPAEEAIKAAKAATDKVWPK